MAYTETKTYNQLRGLLDDPSVFYQAAPYRKGKMKESKSYSDDFVASFVLQELLVRDGRGYYLKSIKKDTRKEYFDTLRPMRWKDKGSSEEIFQRYLYFNGPLASDLNDQLHEEEFLWFELSGQPRKNKGIDLLSYNKKEQRVSIYELKFGDVNEHLIKAVLEIATYHQRTRFEDFHDHWKKHFEKANKPDSHFENLDLVFDVNNVRKVVLIDARTLAADQWKHIGDYPHVLELIELLGITVIVFEGAKYSIESMKEHMSKLMNQRKN